jgi:hypothetical protein
VNGFVQLLEYRNIRSGGRNKTGDLGVGHKSAGENQQRWTFIRRFVVLVITAGLMFLYAGVASGQNYPNRPIRMLTTEVGGGADFVARVVAQGLSGTLGQQVIVDNRGAGLSPGK